MNRGDRFHHNMNMLYSISTAAEERTLPLYIGIEIRDREIRTGTTQLGYKKVCFISMQDLGLSMVVYKVKCDSRML